MSALECAALSDYLWEFRDTYWFHDKAMRCAVAASCYERLTGRRGLTGWWEYPGYSPIPESKGGSRESPGYDSLLGPLALAITKESTTPRRPTE